MNNEDRKKVRLIFSFPSSSFTFIERRIVDLRLCIRLRPRGRRGVSLIKVTMEIAEFIEMRMEAG